MNEAIQNLVNRMIADYENWQTKPRTEIQARMLDEYINGIEIDHGTPELYDLTIAVAEGRLEKLTIANDLRRIARLP